MLRSRVNHTAEDDPVPRRPLREWRDVRRGTLPQTPRWKPSHHSCRAIQVCRRIFYRGLF